jgi:hypothetical protein
LGARDRFLGWGAIERERRIGFLVQNDRFLLIPDVPVGNLASRALGLCTQRLAADWERAFGSAILGVETFVDPSRFSGTCYRAANWECVGETQGYGQDGAGYKYHGQPKTVWLYPLRSTSWEVLRGGSLPAKLREFERMPTGNTVRSNGSPLPALLPQSLPNPRRYRPSGGRRSAVRLATAICQLPTGPGNRRQDIARLPGPR